MAAMTPTEQWIMCLALIYAIPSFLSGVGVTLLYLHWQDRTAMAPGFLTIPWQIYEGRDVMATPTAERHYLLPEGLRLL